MVRAVRHDRGDDEVAIEEPLEIRAGGEPLAVTMRTPGNDEELALGFLFGEALIEEARAAGPTEDFAANPADRRFYTSSSCGVCGKGALEQVEVGAVPVGWEGQAPRELLAGLPERLQQPGFTRTGGLHATGLFDLDGTALCVREDVGRHNAMDKVIGWALREGALPLAGRVLCVSGRLSFELVQKAARARAPFLVGVGAPTSLAISLAEAQRITLCGFAREGEINVYSGAGRVG
jgi:FdhD protein